MTTFLIVCAVMVVAALVLLLVPLLRNEKAPAKGETGAGRAVPAAVVMMVALPLGASAFYTATSNFPWDNPAALKSAASGHAQGAGSMDEVTAQLEKRLAGNPGDQEGWRMLGRTYLITGRAAEAATAYERANALTGGKDPSIQLDLAEALVLAGDPGRQAQAREIIDAALAADASNQKALWYGGLMAQRSDDVETAKALWSRLLATQPPEEIRQILVGQLAQLGVTVPAGESAASAAAGGTAAGGMARTDRAGGGAEPSGRTLRVAVSVDPALADRIRPGTVVFVSAREAGIPGPPLAAVRMSSDELPTTVVLSDANAMVEGRNLSSVDEVQVVARVAFGGSAVSSSGDLLGEIRHSKGSPSDLNVVIDKVVP